MRKFYSLFLFVVVATMAFAVQAKTVTLKVDDASHLSQVFWTSASDKPVEFTNNEGTLTTGDSEHEYVVLFPASGYEIVSVTDANGTSLYTYGDLPTESNISLNFASVADGSTVTITTGVPAVKEAKIFTINGGNSSFYVTLNGNSLQWNGSGWSAEITATWNYVQIYDSNSNEKIKYVVDENGRQYTKNSQGCVYISASDYDGSMNFNIVTYNPDEARTKEFTVTVKGNAGLLQMAYADGSSINLASDSDNTVKFDPETDTFITVKHQQYWMNKLYVVEFDGTPLSPNYENVYSFTPAEGSTLYIEVEAPKVEVPLSFKFTNEGTEDAVTGVTVNYENRDDWNSGNFTVMSGQTVAINLNTNLYEIQSVKFNGEPQYVNYGYVSITINSTEPSVIEIDAVKPTPKFVTIVAEYPQGVRYCIGNDYNGTVLAEEETTIEVPSGQNLTIKAADTNWTVTKIFNLEDESQTYQIDYPFQVTDGLQLFVEVSPYERNKQFIAFIEETEWQYFSMTLSANNYAHRESYTFGNPGCPITTGYNTVNFCDDDMPLGIGGYPTPVVYINDQPETLEYGAFTTPLADGDVVKFFSSEPASHKVTYTIDENVSAEVYHDHITRIDMPSTHNVFHGTLVHIRPAASAYTASASSIKVKADGNDVPADENGQYAITVNADTNIEVTGATNGIDDITVAGTDAETPVYNLQGIRVARAADFDSLPAGLYIVNGSKVRK